MDNEDRLLVDDIVVGFAHDGAQVDLQSVPHCMAGKPHSTWTTGDGIPMPRVGVQGRNMSGSNFQTSALQLKIHINDDGTRAITNDVFPKSIVWNDGAFRKRKPAYVRNLFTRKDAVVNSSFTNTFSGFRENWTTATPRLSRVNVGSISNGWFGDHGRVDLRIVQRMRFLRRDVEGGPGFEARRSQVVGGRCKDENDTE
jgi:hypothetical protein